MAVTTSDLSDAVATALTSSATIDLGAFVDGLPSGTTADLEVRGDRSSYELEFRRNGYRWIVEGAGSAAELTGVYATDDVNPRDVERVPSWMRPVLAAFEINEVSVRR
ncbi:hypothetical protein ACFQGT_00350 [Natrialbaceae archaeon GCM10025810]